MRFFLKIRKKTWCLIHISSSVVVIILYFSFILRSFLSSIILYTEFCIPLDATATSRVAPQTDAHTFMLSFNSFWIRTILWNIGLQFLASGLSKSGAFHKKRRFHEWPSLCTLWNTRSKWEICVESAVFVGFQCCFSWKVQCFSWKAQRFREKRHFSWKAQCFSLWAFRLSPSIGLSFERPNSSCHLTSFTLFHSFPFL